MFIRDTLLKTTDIVSVSNSEELGNADSFTCAVTDDGRFVAFASSASNLVPNDTNGHRDVFVRDRVNGTTERVSVSSAGAQGDAGDPDEWAPIVNISQDGRFVAFQTNLRNLVAGTSTSLNRIFVRDRALGTTELISQSSAGEAGNGSSQYPSLSDDGRYVAYESEATNLVSGDTNGRWDVFLRDRLTGTTRRISVSSNGVQANRSSGAPCLSGDGLAVVFASEASNLVPGDTNLCSDAFIRFWQPGTTERISVSDQESQANWWSGWPWTAGNGRFVVFESGASNLVSNDLNYGVHDIFLRDRLLGTTEKISIAPNMYQGVEGVGWGRVSASGTRCLFTTRNPFVPVDTNGSDDVYVRMRLDPQPYCQLDVASFAPTTDILITVPVDRDGLGAGKAPFVRIYEPNSVVNFTAPSQYDSRLLDHFEVDGVRATSPIMMDRNHRIKAFYVKGCILTVQASVPGVRIHLSQPDYFGKGDAFTSFTRTYKVMTPVSVTAPASAGGKAFLHWEKGGVAQTGGMRTMNVLLASDFTVKAVYSP